jgi:hypothetical protein
MLIRCVNCMTWVRRYMRKASLDQRPMSMMVYTGTRAMCIAMAAAERIGSRADQMGSTIFGFEA